MTTPLRVFINGAPVDVEAGTDVRGALHAHDATLEARYAAGTAYVTDARGIEMDGTQRLAAGAIMRVVLRSRRSEGGDDAHA